MTTKDTKIAKSLRWVAASWLRGAPWRSWCPWWLNGQRLRRAEL